MHKVLYWDSSAGTQRERDSTPEEDAQRELDIARDSIVPPAESIPMLNLQLVLIEDGKLATVQAILDGMTGDDGAKAQAYWAKALTARRDNYLVNQMWPVLYATEAEFNDAWARAAALNP